MTKKAQNKVIIIIFSIVLILLISIYILNQYEVYILTVENIYDDHIRANLPLYKTYTLSKNIIIYDKDGNILNISDMKVGDTIFFIPENNDNLESAIIEEINNFNNTFTVSCVFTTLEYPIPIQDPKNIKIIDYNRNEISISKLNIGDTLYVVMKKNPFKNNFEEPKLIQLLTTE